MPNLNGLIFFLGMVAGGTIVWFGKNFIQKIIIGAPALAAKLEAQAQSLKNTISKL